MNWKALLETRPIETPDGKALHTLAHARTYLIKMPESEATLQAAGELLKAARHGGPFLMIARMSVYGAIYGKRHSSTATAGKGEAGPLEGAEEEAMTNRRPILNDRELTEAELEQIRHILESFDGLGTVSDEMRLLIEQQWPHLLAKIKPRRT